MVKIIFMGQDNFQGLGQFFIFVAIIKKFRMVDCVFSFVHIWYNLNLLFFKYLLIIIKSALFILMDVSVNINFLIKYLIKMILDYW